MSRISVTKLHPLYFQPATRVSVFSALRNDTHTPVAVKEQVFASVEEANRSIREAMNQVQLTHPNICQAFDCYLEEKGGGVAAVIVLELMDKDLSQEIADRQKSALYWSEEQLLDFLAGLTSALRYAESRGVSHRDIKPQNIFLKNSQPKLGDFGSSGSYLDVEKVSKSLQGTPFFLSPELKHVMADALYFAGGEIAYDPFKADVYSLGVTVLFMARLRPPEELMDLQRLKENTQRVIAELVFYPRLGELLSLMLEIDPSARLSFEQLEYSLQSVQRDSMQTLQSLPNLELTLKPCIICARPVTSQRWTALIPADCCRYWDFFGDMCSLQCLTKLKAAMEERGATSECLWCLNPQKVIASELVYLPCGHAFHEKMCLFSFLRCMSENFNVAVNFKCPKCFDTITQEFIDEVIGKTQYEESKYVFKSASCMKCGVRQAEKYCKYQHIMCRQCTGFFFYFIPMCPICQTLRVSALPKTDSDFEVARILHRPPPPNLPFSA